MVDIIIAITGDSENTMLYEYWLNKAHNQICTYLNKEFTKEETEEKFKDALIQIAVDSYYSKMQGSVQSKSQGQRSITYKTNTGGLSDEVKKLLPRPFVKLR